MTTVDRTPERAALDRYESILVPTEGLVRVYVWDLVVRVTHWLIALSLLALSITGIFIGDPYIAEPGEAVDGFVMGHMRAVHLYVALVFTLAVLSRIGWMFVGPRQARWWNFTNTHPERLYGLWGTLSFYLFLRARPPFFLGHNPLAGATYMVVFLLYLVMIGTGLGMWATGADVGSWVGWFDWTLSLFGGTQTARWIHHVVMWLLVGFFVHHLYSSILMSKVEKNGLMGSIFSGYKFVTREESEL